LRDKKLNVIFLTPDDNLHLTYFFYNFFKKFNRDIISIKGVVIQKTLGKNKKSDLFFPVLQLYGIFGFSKILIQLFYKKLLSIFCLSDNINFLTLNCIFKRNNIDVLNFDNINSDEALDFLKNLDLDLIISVSSSQKLKEKILKLPKFGCINIHNAKLPKNRGMMPVFWAIYNCNTEPVSAITIHKMNEYYDDGTILLQEDFDINPDKSMEYYIKKTKLRGAELLIELLVKYISGEPETIPNDKQNATTKKFPDKYQIKEFKKRGFKVR
jgi:methionyl-tRNA formyltransferase